MSSRLGGAAAAACALALACAPTRRAGLEDATPLTTSGPPLDRGTSDTPQLLSGPPAPPRVYDVAVVGAGLAGLASARYLAVRGASVVVIEAQDAVAAGASSGNSGLGCTGYDAPAGSLESRLLRRSAAIHASLYRSFGLGHGHVAKSGSLVVAWSAEEASRLPRVLEENAAAGDAEVCALDAPALAASEPGLARGAAGAVACPHEAVVEPWLVPVGYAESARLHGAAFMMGTELVAAARERVGGEAVWVLGTVPSTAADVGRSGVGELLVRPPPPPGPGRDRAEAAAVSGGAVVARVVVNAAGLWGDAVEALRPRRVDGGGAGAAAATFTIRPRKGQFVVYRPTPGCGPAHIIEPVPTDFTKGVIAWTSVYGNVIVGPTAVEQLSRTDRSTDAATVSALRAFGERLLPCLRDVEVLGTYSGLRPATEHRDYQIRADASEAWVTVAGIRSTGLSASPGIGEYVAELYESVRRGAPVVHASDAVLGVSEALRVPAPADGVVPNAPVPPLSALAAEYAARGDGAVTIYGRAHRVTHPIASFGMQSIGQAAAAHRDPSGRT